MARKKADENAAEDSQKAQGEAEGTGAADQTTKAPRAPQKAPQATEDAGPAEEELGEDDRDYEAEADAARSQEANRGVQQGHHEARGPLPGGMSEPASSPEGGPPRLAPEVAAEVARSIAKEGEGKDVAGPAIETQEPAEGDMPTLARAEAAGRAALDKAGGDPAKAPGQPPVEDPNRAPTSTESAMNQEVIGRKGDSAPMHPSQNAGAGSAPITPNVEATRPDDQRRFRVISGMVGGFRVGRNGEPSNWVSLNQLNITAEMVPRLIQLGVMQEQE
jgi:hypothetical protein